MPYPSDSFDPAALVSRVPALLPNLDETSLKMGRSVGMHAEMMPDEVSTVHQVQAFPSVQATSVGSNWKRVVKRYILVKMTLTTFH